MKEKLIISFILVIFLVSLLPFPQNIERTYYGVNAENGEKVDIVLDMKHFRFLFLKDKMKGTITVKTDKETFTYGEHLHYTGLSHSKNNAGDYTHDFSGWYYNENMYMKKYENGTVSKMPIGFESLLVHISSNLNKILILHNNTANGEVVGREDSRYIGSVEQNQFEETKEYFSGYYGWAKE